MSLNSANNSGLCCQRKTTQFRLENENSEPQMWDKHGHVVISVCVILNLSNHSIIFNVALFFTVNY